MAAAAVAGDGGRRGVERRREAWRRHDYCGCNDMTTTKKLKSSFQKRSQFSYSVIAAEEAVGHWEVVAA